VKATIVVGLAFGDEGKGTVVDWLSRRSPGATIVRFCGGPQAAHNVVTADGRHHTFAQFGSGMFVPGTTTHLSRFMMVNPFNMVIEARHLEAVGVPDPWRRTTVDPAALVVTPYHKGLNRLRELARGPRRHGSCGQGIGETMADWLARGSECVLAGDLLFPKNLVRKLGVLRAIAGKEAERIIAGAADLGARTGPFAECHVQPIVLAERYGEVVKEMRFRYDEELSLCHAEHLVFEGSQGVLLDQDHGLFPPHVTWSTTTPDNAFAILERCGYDGPVEVLGVVRSYMTRHGAGPFETEDPDLAVPEAHNGHGEWQGAWRQGWLDLNVLRYAVDRSQGIDGLVMTHMDRVPREGWPVRTEERPPPYPVFAKDGYAERVADDLGVPLYATSHGPTAADKLVNAPAGRNG
jgi:adenylosuccinate synthase